MRGRWITRVAMVACLFPLALTGCGNSGPPDFTLSLGTDQASSVTLTQGTTTPITFQVAALKGSSGSITLVVSGLPKGVGVAPGTATVGIGSPQIFELSAATDADMSMNPVTLTATGVSGNPLDDSSITHTQTLTLTVAAPAAQ